MPARAPRTPSYRHHKPTNQAVVTLNGRDFYLGRYNSPESRAEYDRLIAEWLSNGRQIAMATDGGPVDVTVVEVVAAYLRHCETYYTKDGAPTTEPANIKLAMRPLRSLYGRTPAHKFGPLALRAVRQAMIESGLCRNEVNKRTAHVVRCFKWAVEHELVPPSVHHGLRAVSGLRKGRSEARESLPVKPVPEAFVDAIRPFVAPQILAMIELQRLTAMRPGEVVLMRTCDLDTSGRVWTYTPRRHKTEHHGRDRTIYLGPKAQEIVRSWLRTDLAAYLFSPREVMEANYARRRRERKTPRTPSSLARKRVKQRQRRPGEHYSTMTYGRAIAAGCKKAGVPPWGPHRLRHNAATWLRKEFGLDVARVILGHSSPAVTEVYAEVDRGKAVSVMERVG
jgi:integrase